MQSGWPKEFCRLALDRPLPALEDRERLTDLGHGLFRRFGIDDDGIGRMRDLSRWMCVSISPPQARRLPAS